MIQTGKKITATIKDSIDKLDWVILQGDLEHQDVFGPGGAYTTDDWKSPMVIKEAKKEDEAYKKKMEEARKKKEEEAAAAAAAAGK